MQHERLFDNAVTLAAAFIANGDIRLSGSVRADSTAMAMTRDLIEGLYERLIELDHELAPSLGTKP